MIEAQATSRPPLPADEEVLAVLEVAAAAPTLRKLRTVLRPLRARLAPLPVADDPDAAADTEEATALAADLDQIMQARTVARARYYVDRLRRGLCEDRTTGYNDLNLNRWRRYDDVWTDSLWQIPTRDRSGRHAADYWGNFVPQIPRQLMWRYSRRGDWVLDPFLGSGTTLIECRRLGRNALGVELKPKTAAAAEARIAAENDPFGTVQRVLHGDAAALDLRAELDAAGVEHVQLAVMHPPYHDIIRFSDDPRDLSNAPDEGAFLDGLEAVARNAVEVLQPGRFAALVIGDKYARGAWVPLGFQAMARLQALGLVLKSIVVKDFQETTGKRQQQALWRYRALAGGFYVFKHEYVFIFQKR